MCVSQEQIKDVLEALDSSVSMMPATLISYCEAVNTWAELAEVVSVLEQRGYVVLTTLGVKLNEKLGVCDGCGVVDHHLLGGECPTCRARSTWLDSTHHPLDDSSTQLHGGVA